MTEKKLSNKEKKKPPRKMQSVETKMPSFIGRGVVVGRRVMLV